jgi:3,4-dihydroxy 2-butanone 4-phosphate synthase/GTP cyclohydrolase II
MIAAGLRPVAAISEIVADDGEMMRFPGLLELGAVEGVPVITIAQFILWLGTRDLSTISTARLSTSDAPVTTTEGVTA